MAAGATITMYKTLILLDILHDLYLLPNLSQHSFKVKSRIWKILPFPEFSNWNEESLPICIYQHWDQWCYFDRYCSTLIRIGHWSRESWIIFMNLCLFVCACNLLISDLTKCQRVNILISAYSTITRTRLHFIHKQLNGLHAYSPHRK